jgi:sulfate permease, SulP family
MKRPFELCWRHNSPPPPPANKHILYIYVLEVLYNIFRVSFIMDSKEQQDLAVSSTKSSKDGFLADSVVQRAAVAASLVEEQERPGSSHSNSGATGLSHRNAALHISRSDDAHAIELESPHTPSTSGPGPVTGPASTAAAHSNDDSDDGKPHSHNHDTGDAMSFFHDPKQPWTAKLAALLPSLTIINWLGNYKFTQDLMWDVIAGLTVGVFVVPQGMAYALLADMPVQFGLYTAWIPPLLYPLFGTSRQIAVGPVAIVSLLTAEALSPIVTVDDDLQRYVELGAVLTFMVGVIQLVLGFMHAGIVANFLSKPVIVGFKSAAALIVGASQLKHVLAISVERGDFGPTIYRVFENIGDSQWPAILFGVGTILILMFLKFLKRRSWNDPRVKTAFKLLPGALLVVALGLVISGATNYTTAEYKKYLPIIGDIPAGLPAIKAPQINLDDFQLLVPSAFLIALIGFTQTISMGKVFAEKNKYEVDATQELVATGFAATIGAFFQCIPHTGGLGRTAVNAEAGARTPLASMISSCVVLLTLIVITPLFETLPKSVLAGIVLTAVSSLFEWKEMVYIWHVKRSDAYSMVATFVGSLALGIVFGIGIGVALSLGVIVTRAVAPHFTEECYVEEVKGYRNIQRYPHGRLLNNAAILRFDAPLYFVNFDAFRSAVYSTVRRHRRRMYFADHPDEDGSTYNPGACPNVAAKYPMFLILDCSSMVDVDFTALQATITLVRNLRRVNHVVVLIARLEGPVHDVLSRGDFFGAFLEEHTFSHVPFAVEFVRKADAAQVLSEVSANDQGTNQSVDDVQQCDSDDNDDDDDDDDRKSMEAVQVQIDNVPAAAECRSSDSD